ncbi:hypothetical protein NUSPORA_01707 [Nucleospora cyclopteri]
MDFNNSIIEDENNAFIEKTLFAELELLGNVCNIKNTEIVSENKTIIVQQPYNLKKNFKLK